MKYIISLILLSISLLGQAPSTYPFFVAAPMSPRPLVTVTNGVPGGPSYYYFIVVRYASGNALTANPGRIGRNSPVTLSMSAFNTISWPAQPNATGYDVLRTTTPNFSGTGTCTNCLVSSNTSSLSVTDTANSHSGYTLINPVQSVAGQITLGTNPSRFIFIPSLSFLGQITGTSSAIGGGALTASCATGIITIVGGTVGHPVAVSPAADITTGGTIAFSVFAVVTSPTVVTVYVCGTGTPTSRTYQIATY